MSPNGLHNGIFKSSLRLDRLPEEVLIHVFVRVPFDKTTFGNIRRVCRRFRSIIGTLKVPENPILKAILREQFGAVDIAFGTGSCDLNSINSLHQIDARTEEILGRITSCMTANDLAAEADDWEDDVFHGLVLLEKLASLRLSSKEWHALQGSLDKNALLLLRYACCRLARCICASHKWNYVDPGSDIDLVHTARLRQIRNPSHLTTSLERLVLYGFGLRDMTSIQSAVTRILDEADWSANHFEAYTKLNLEILHAEPYSVALYHALGWDVGTSAEVWLCDPKRLNDVIDLATKFVLCTSRTQSNVTELILRTSTMNVINVINYICDHKRTLEDRAKSDEELSSSEGHELQGSPSTTPPNERTKKLARSAIEAGHPLDQRLVRKLVLDYDWECALDEELVNGHSPLRRSCPPGLVTLKFACATITRYQQQRSDWVAG